MANTKARIPPLLLPEALGFSPQLLLDDIINIANNAVQDGVNGMEAFLQKWADERSTRHGGQWDSTHEVEQGLVAFQTLLEHHTDIAFDIFEAWSLRNIFAVPSDLPFVLPHQQGLDLSQPPEREQELMDEIDELRKKIDAQRKLNRTLRKAVRVAKIQRTRAERTRDLLSLFEPTDIEPLTGLPRIVLLMHNEVSRLDPREPPAIGQVPEPGKRQWETSKGGYMNWVMSQLLSKTRASSGPGGSRNVDEMLREISDVGDAAQLRNAIAAFEGDREVENDIQDMETG